MTPGPKRCRRSSASAICSAVLSRKVACTCSGVVAAEQGSAAELSRGPPTLPAAASAMTTADTHERNAPRTLMKSSGLWRADIVAHHRQAYRDPQGRCSHFWQGRLMKTVSQLRLRHLSHLCGRQLKHIDMPFEFDDEIRRSKRKRPDAEKRPAYVLLTVTTEIVLASRPIVSNDRTRLRSPLGMIALAVPAHDNSPGGFALAGIRMMGPRSRAPGGQRVPASCAGWRCSQ